MSLRLKSIAGRRLPVIVGVALMIVAAVVVFVFVIDDEVATDTPAAAASGYMRAQATADPKACDLMTEEMQQQWIDSVTLSFEPDVAPETCDQATKVFIAWGEANNQLLPDPATIKITATTVQQLGEEATVKVRVELSETNRTETTLQLSRVEGRWLVSGTQAAL